MLNVHLITTNFPPSTGGVARYLYEIVRFLPEQQIRVTATDIEGADEFDSTESLPIRRLWLPRRLPNLLKHVWLACRLCVSIVTSSDNCILCYNTHLRVLIPAWVNYRVRGVKFAVFAYGRGLQVRQRNKYKRPILNRLLSDACAVITCSQFTTQMVVDLGFSSKKSHTVLPTFTADHLETPVSKEYLQNKFDIPVDRRLLLTTGRLVERKGHDTLIRALPDIIRCVPNVHYIIAGTGVNRSNLEELVRSLELEKYVTFTGYVSDSELAGLYSICDVFAMISRELAENGDVEGFGIVFLEANLFRKPVVGGESGGVPDAVVNGKTGLLVDPDSLSEVKESVVKLLVDRELAEELGSAGYARVIEEFGAGTAAQHVWQILTDECHELDG